MPPVDNPLKLLIYNFSHIFAEWLLGQPVHQVQPLNIELPASTSRADLLFKVIQADGQMVLLHIEQQGRSSQPLMPWRMLEYMTRLVLRELSDQVPGVSVRLHNVVIYTGNGAGLNDNGRYEIQGLDGTPRLSWRYEPLRLWQMQAEELLRLGQPAFLPLIGQTRLEEPEQILPAVLAEIRRVVDETERGRLLTALTSLMRSEEVLEMIEKMIDDVEDPLLDTPYLRRIRQQGREEGWVEGITKGREEGLTEGLARGKEAGLTEGRETGLMEGLARGKEAGVIEGLREAILEAITVRFDPPASEYRQVSQQLANLIQREQLQRLHVAAIQAENMPDFIARLAEELSQASEVTS